MQKTQELSKTELAKSNAAPGHTSVVIVDETEDDPDDTAILRLYNAGILTGVDDKGTFLPDAPITREQIAAVVTRAADPILR